MQCVSGYLGCGQVVLACPGQYIFIKTSLRKLGFQNTVSPLPSSNFYSSYWNMLCTWCGSAAVVGSDILALFIHVMTESL